MSHFFCKQFFFLLSTFISSTFICNAQVSVNPGAGSYPTLTAAFAAINAGTHTGALTIDIVGNTAEGTSTAVLNASGSGAASYTSIVISPSGGAARLITGTTTAGTPLIDLNGADNVTINGLNAGGNSLTIQNETVSATSGTCTIRFIGGATNNVITNCTINGASTSFVATNGGTIFFSTDNVTSSGNDNNTISNNNIGPVGTSLPTKAILGNGSTTSTAIGNSGILIDNNNIFDYFAVVGTSSGIATNGGCNTWSITNNRFYQTGTRTWTTGATHRAIDINNTTATSGATGFTITGNTIGYASNTQTGTYTLTGSTGKFQAINFNGINGGSATNINNNTIASISLTGVTSSGTGSSSPFLGILVSNGVANTNNNTIGSQSTNSSLVFSTNTTIATDVIGINNFSVDVANMVSNNIGGIAVTNAAASGNFVIYGLRLFTGTGRLATLTSNTIGGSVPNSIQLSATGSASQVIGIATQNAPALFTSNTIRNLTSNVGTGTTTTASVIGILVNNTSPNHTLSQNTIFNLTNTNATAATVVTGIQFTGGTANVVERNSIYDLTSATNSTTAEINGIRVAGGTTVYRNNMIRLGQGVINAIGGAATNSSTAGINGFNGALGTDQFIHNSVYIGGSPTAGVGSSFAFNGTQTTNTRTFRNNVFFNARSNNGATGKNYAIKINGTTANPAGLTLNNNNYFANETGGIFGFFNGADVANLAAWQVAVGQDANSLSVDPLFVSTTDLHLAATSTMIDAGVNLSVANDFDGDTRGTTVPDIGADENNFSVLPLRWLEIQGAFNYNKQAVIIFKVNENNVAQYVIEKSNDGRSFTAIGTLSSIGNGENTYRFTDVQTVSKINYYKVKQMDVDGRFSFSPIVKIAVNASVLSVFPNPISSTATVSGAKVGTTLQLVDVSGKLLQNIKVTNPTFTVDMSGYSKGLYLLQGNKQVIKIMKE